MCCEHTDEHAQALYLLTTLVVPCHAGTCLMVAEATPTNLGQGSTGARVQRRMATGAQAEGMSFFVAAPLAARSLRKLVEIRAMEIDCPCSRTHAVSDHAVSVFKELSVFLVECAVPSPLSEPPVPCPCQDACVSALCMLHGRYASSLLRPRYEASLTAGKHLWQEFHAQVPDALGQCFATKSRC